MSRLIGAVSCISFLLLQWSGAHVHANDAGFVGGPETAYPHNHVHHDHDHDGARQSSDPIGDGAFPESSASGDDYDDARDVSIFDQTHVAFKPPLAILALVFLFAIVPLVRALAGAERAYRVLSGRHTRWRPPLRAPPQPASI